jgi:hypothetical protein
MNPWIKQFKFDPTLPLEQSSNLAIQYFYQKDILGKTEIDIKDIWALYEPQRIINKQHDGSWTYPNKHAGERSLVDYEQVETYRQLRYLIEMYGFNKEHITITKAAEFFFKYQTKTGDIRGIYGNQYSPNYTAAILELLIKTGYKDDPRIHKALVWLMSVRQNDGGWALPFRTKGYDLGIIYGSDVASTNTIEPDLTKPFSHFVTGIVLRAFAAHSGYSNSAEIRHAGQLLIGRFFKRDTYVDLNKADQWMKFSYPFWQTDLLSSLDSLSKLGFSADEPNIVKAMQWIESQQNTQGTFNLHLVRGGNKDAQLWVNLAICRVYCRFFNQKAN